MTVSFKKETMKVPSFSPLETKKKTPQGKAWGYWGKKKPEEFAGKKAPAPFAEKKR